MGKIISLVNQKGGVGKTTTSINLAASLGILGKKTLLVDLDPQGNATTGVGIEKGDLKVSLYDALINTIEPKNSVKKTKFKNLDLIPSSLKLAGIEFEFIDKQNQDPSFLKTSQLKRVLYDLKEQYDYILIDCPPTLGLLTINALVASDYVIAPCETTPLSVYALDDLEETIKAVKGTNPKLKFLGVIATKYVSNSLSHNTSLNELKERFNVIGIIKNSVSSQKGIDDGLPCVVADPKSIVAEGYREVINKLKEEL